MPISFFWGEEDYLIEQEINKMKSEILGGEISELNYKTTDNPDFKTLIFLMRSQPMMFGDILINIKADKYFLSTAKKNDLDDKQITELIDTLDLISDKVHIILTCLIPRGDKKKPDSRKKFYKALQKKGTIKEFPAFKPWEEYKMLPVLKNMMKEMDLKAGGDVQEEIIKRSGPYLRDIKTTLDKLSLYAYPENIIKPEMLENVKPVSSNIFALVDLILENNNIKALNEISAMSEQSHPLEILAFLQSSFSMVLNTKILSKKMSSFDIARKTGQNEYRIKKTIEKIRNVKLDKIIKLKQKLIMAEYEIKTGEKEPLTALLEAFVK